jgi:DNA-binding transcriptional regulator YdaS (Cro superfamily)
MRDPGLRKAIEAAGSRSELARRLGISQQAVSQWRTIPPRQIVAVEQATGVPREELRPDLYREGGSGVSNNSGTGG